MSAPLHVVHEHLERFAHDHEMVGYDVLADATSTGCTAPMAAAYGPAGAVFTAAAAAFESAVAKSGAGLVENYQEMAAAIRATSQVISDTDTESAARLRSSTAPG